MSGAAMDLAALPPGFADPVLQPQAVFRSLLDAMARPGHIVALTSEVHGHLPNPPGCSRAAAAVLLALTDAEVRLHLAPPAPPLLADWLRFHTGVRLAPEDSADWLLFDAAALHAGGFARWRHGDDESPHGAATLLVDVPLLQVMEPTAPVHADACVLDLQGPGIETRQRLAVGGVDASFWRQRIAQQTHFPRGVDLVLCCGHRLAALPRSTRVQLTEG